MNINESTPKSIIEVKELSTYFGNVCVHEQLNLTIYKGEIIAIVGGSGCGKSTLVREILMLQKPTSGHITVFGKDLSSLNHKEVKMVRNNIGVMFQHGALFSSLTVMENVSFPLRLFTNLPPDSIEDIALLKIALSGLPIDAATKYPSELSGGMIKRAAVARAIAMDPQLLFLDEPTAGLDPNGASALDELILELKSSLELTIVMVTHDLETLWRVADRVAFLGDHKVLMVGSMTALSAAEHPLIHDYFSGPRAEAAHHMLDLE